MPRFNSVYIAGLLGLLLASGALSAQLKEFSNKEHLRRAVVKADGSIETEVVPSLLQIGSHTEAKAQQKESLVHSVEHYLAGLFTHGFTRTDSSKSFERAASSADAPISAIEKSASSQKVHAASQSGLHQGGVISVLETLARYGPELDVKATSLLDRAVMLLGATPGSVRATDGQVDSWCDLRYAGKGCLQFAALQGAGDKPQFLTEDGSSNGRVRFSGSSALVSSLPLHVGAVSSSAGFTLVALVSLLPAAGAGEGSSSGEQVLVQHSKLFRLGVNFAAGKATGRLAVSDQSHTFTTPTSQSFDDAVSRDKHTVVSLVVDGGGRPLLFVNGVPQLLEEDDWTAGRDARALNPAGAASMLQRAAVRVEALDDPQLAAKLAADAALENTLESLAAKPRHLSFGCAVSGGTSASNCLSADVRALALFDTALNPADRRWVESSFDQMFGPANNNRVNIQPTATLTRTQAGEDAPVSSGSFELTLDFSEPVASDCALPSGAPLASRDAKMREMFGMRKKLTSLSFETVDGQVSQLRCVDGFCSAGGLCGKFAVTVQSPVSAGKVEVRVKDRAAEDAQGDPNTAPNIMSVVIDRIAPTVSVFAVQKVVTHSAGRVLVNVVFSEQVVGFTDKALQACTSCFSNAKLKIVAAAPNGAPGAYQLELEALMEGEVVVSLPQGIAKDRAGNPSEAALPLSVQWLKGGPSVTLSSGLETGEFTNKNPFPLELDFTQRVNALEASDVNADIEAGDDSVTATVVSAIGGGMSWVAYVELSDSSKEVTVSLQVPADAIVDVNGMKNAQPSNAYSVTYDPVPPELLLQSLDLQPGLVPDTKNLPAQRLADPLIAQPTNISPLHFALFASEPLKRFRPEDLVLSNARLMLDSETNATRWNVTANNGRFDFWLVPTVPEGQVSVSVPTGRAKDRAGNGNTAVVSLVVKYDSVPPTVTRFAGASCEHAVAGNITYELAFSEPVQPLDVSNLQPRVGANTLLSLDQKTPSSYAALVKPAHDGQVRFTLEVADVRDLAGNQLAAAPPAAVCVSDNTPPHPEFSLFGGAVSPTNMGRVPVRVVFPNEAGGLVKVVAGQEALISHDMLTRLEFPQGGACINSTGPGADALCRELEVYVLPNLDGLANRRTVSTAPYSVQIGVADRAVRDVAGNPSDGNIFAFEFDQLPPRVHSIEAEGPAYTTSRYICFKLALSEPVAHFTRSNILVVNGAISETDHDAFHQEQVLDEQQRAFPKYRFCVRPTADGPVSVAAKLASYADPAGNVNADAGPSVHIMFDSTAPRATGHVKEGPSGIHAKFTAVFEFDEPVKSLDRDHIATDFIPAQQQGAAGSYSVPTFRILHPLPEVFEDAKANFTRLVLEVTAPSGLDGRATVTLKKDAVQDLAGNPLYYAEVAEYSVDTQAPTVLSMTSDSNTMPRTTLASGLLSPEVHVTNRTAFTITVTFSKAVVGMDGGSVDLHAEELKRDADFAARQQAAKEHLLQQLSVIDAQQRAQTTTTPAPTHAPAANSALQVEAKVQEHKGWFSWAQVGAKVHVHARDAPSALSGSGLVIRRVRPVRGQELGGAQLARVWEVDVEVARHEIDLASEPGRDSVPLIFQLNPQVGGIVDAAGNALAQAPVFNINFDNNAPRVHLSALLPGHVDGVEDGLDESGVPRLSTSGKDYFVMVAEFTEPVALDLSAVSSFFKVTNADIGWIAPGTGSVSDNPSANGLRYHFKVMPNTRAAGGRDAVISIQASATAANEFGQPVVRDIAGNRMAQDSNQLAVLLDVTPPKLAISLDRSADATSCGAVPFRLVASEKVFAKTSAGLNLAPLTRAEFFVVDGSIDSVSEPAPIANGHFAYTLSVTRASTLVAGPLTLGVRSGSLRDAVGNLNNETVQAIGSVDCSHPSVVSLRAEVASNGASGLSFLVTAGFNKTVSSVALSAATVRVVNGVVRPGSAAKVSDREWSFVVDANSAATTTTTTQAPAQGGSQPASSAAPAAQPAQQASIVSANAANVQLLAGFATDESGNASVESSTLEVALDQPVCSFENVGLSHPQGTNLWVFSAADKAARNGFVLVSLNCSRPVTVRPDSFLLTSPTGSVQPTAISGTSGSDSSFSFWIAPDEEGVIKVALVGLCEDGLRMPCLAPQPLEFRYDITPPAVVSITAAAQASGSLWPVTVVFSEAVTRFSAKALQGKGRARSSTLDFSRFDHLAPLGIMDADCAQDRTTCTFHVAPSTFGSSEVEVSFSSEVSELVTDIAGNRMADFTARTTFSFDVPQCDSSRSVVCPTDPLKCLLSGSASSSALHTTVCPYSIASDCLARRVERNGFFYYPLAASNELDPSVCQWQCGTGTDACPLKSTASLGLLSSGSMYGWASDSNKQLAANQYCYQATATGGRMLSAVCPYASANDCSMRTGDIVTVGAQRYYTLPTSAVPAADLNSRGQDTARCAW